MNVILFSLLAIVLLVAAVPVVIQLGQSFGRSAAFNALTHPEGRISLAADAPFSDRYLLVTRGVSNVCSLCESGDLPLGVMLDEASDNDVSVGLPKAIQLLGAGSDTVRMVAGEAIPLDAEVYAGDGGKVVTEASAQSGDYLVGRIVGEAGADGDEIAVTPTLPVITKP